MDAPCEGFTDQSPESYGNGTICWRINGWTQEFHFHPEFSNRDVWFTGLPNMIPAFVKAN
jgi:hypothetical protein